MEERKFGEFMKFLRIRKGMTLREFSRVLGKDPGNISKLERGILPPPKDANSVREYGEALGLSENSEEMKDLIHLAAVWAGKIPEEIMNDEKMLRLLPIFFRTATGSRLDRKKIMEFIEKMRNG